MKDVDFDLKKMMAAKDKAVKGLTGGIEFLFKKYGVEYVKGFGKLTGTNEVTADLTDGGSQVLNTKNVLIATGSDVAPLPPAPVDNDAGKIIDSTGALAMKEVPKKLAVIGGGVIGLEMGSVWNRLGSEVTVIEFLDGIVPSLDRQIAKDYQKILKKQGFNFKLGTKVTQTEVSDSGVALTMEPSKGGDAETLDVDVVLVSTGRRPYTEGLGLDTLGIQVRVWLACGFLCGRFCAVWSVREKRLGLFSPASRFFLLFVPGVCPSHPLLRPTNWAASTWTTSSRRVLPTSTPLETASLVPCSRTRPRRRASPRLRT